MARDWKAEALEAEDDRDTCGSCGERIEDCDEQGK